MAVYNRDCIIAMQELADNSVDCIITDPPYKYLKNQKLEVDFDEKAFFAQANRVLKKGGFIALFGRGTSFYRWNTMLADLGFKFKEELVWDKGHCTSPLMSISRVHETISIHAKGNAKITKVKVPYLKMKSHDIPSIVQDIKRLKTVFSNTKSFDAVKEFLKNNSLEFTKTQTQKKYACTVQEHKGVRNRVASVANSIQNGMNEKSIIRNDRETNEKATKYDVTFDASGKIGDRCVNVAQSIQFGMNEKSIIRQKFDFQTSVLKVTRDHYDTIHPTQKPVDLLERILALISKKGDLVLDPFMGSGSTIIAARNLNRKAIGFEINEEYFFWAKEKIEGILI